MLGILWGLVVFIGSGFAAGNKDFYSDGNIVTGEQWNNVNIYDTPPNHTIVNMSGGNVIEIGCFDASTLNMSGGQIGSELWASEQSAVNISDGWIYGLGSYNDAIVTFSGGNIYTNAMIADFSVFSMYGGTINRLGAMDYSIINLRGGRLTNWLGGSLGTTINIFGHNLSKTNVGGLYGDGQVVGLWEDGTSFIINLSGHDTYAVVNLIPEPATFLLVFAGTILLRKTR